MLNCNLLVDLLMTCLAAAQLAQESNAKLDPVQVKVQTNPTTPGGKSDRPVTKPELQNPGFELGTDGWSIHVYGAQPTIEMDANTTHAGKQSLRISSTEISDTALGQEVKLRPGCWYRFHGWIRTRDLDPKGAPVYGTFQIQMPGRSGLIAGGANHKGDTDWSEVAIEFEAPPGGQIRIAPFFVGFGKGTGTAWFDDLKIEEIELAAEPIKMTRDSLPGKINPLQYGQFIEYLCDLVPSMWAEKLYDGSFEGLTPYKFAYLRETDFKEQPWRPSGDVNHDVFSIDRDKSVSGRVSQKIASEDLTGRVGITQEGIAVAAQAACQFSLYLRQTGMKGPVHVRLHRADKELASCSFEPGSDWKKFQSRLVPTETVANASLSISFTGPGTLWIDNASLMPEDNVGGWRRDVVAAVKALKPGVIRFGGSALDDANLGEFEWKDTIGDPDKRKPFRAWGGLQPTGAGLEEIVQFCRLVDAEPLICVRFSKRRPEDAFEQVQYFNGAADTPLGGLRVKNGHAESYRITKYWCWQRTRGGRLRSASGCDLQSDATGGPVDHAVVELPDRRSSETSP